METTTFHKEAPWSTNYSSDFQEIRRLATQSIELKVEI